ncbi:cryptochrome/photolyase family protein [Chachezhania sediminis]|uniref:cryptochrome/photolyase family protein n=1 Tax=Chachezhania sediminis TaxID=2599291 RepID=UPI00131B2178|nr:deoxyribodipyrimidine photo-lyase [Chachezhania sediminis]
MTTDKTPILLWFRRDLRLTDHPALTAACTAGRPVVPVYILDPETDALGAAPKWRLGQGLDALDAALKAQGSRLICRKGPALQVLQTLIRDTGAGSVWWTRLYDPAAVKRDSKVKSALKDRDIDARSFGGHLLFEPWTIETGTGGPYRVFTPMWKSVRVRDVDAPLASVPGIPAPDTWPEGDDRAGWGLGKAMRRGAAIVASHGRAGEDAARDALDLFLDDRIDRYRDDRDVPAADATSGLSEYLSLGEISPHTVWHAGRAKMEEASQGAETFLKELVWREFAYHLMHHWPHMLTDNWREEWDTFPWKTDQGDRKVIAWQRARTGIPIVDAGLREMYVTGRMHNRVRMIVASYLTKHMMTHWRIGQDWFADCLTDWDPASNAMGWQWVAGSGPDAAPYFRVFNPETQAAKFDPEGAYLDRWLAEGREEPSADALSYFDAIPESWGLSPGDAYPDPIVGLKEGREAALEAYGNRESAA